MRKLLLSTVFVLGVAALSTSAHATTNTLKSGTSITDKKDVGTADLSDKKDVGTADLSDKKDVGTADLN